MGIVYPGVPPALATALQREIGAADFVETGTSYGKTALWASQHFTHVYTIERSAAMYRYATAAHGKVANISFLQGDSREHLRALQPKCLRPAIFWLDAHWSGGESYGEGDECPLLEEIAIIDGGRPDHLLLIDDARLFLAPPPRPHRPEQWPNIVQVLSALTARSPERVVVVIDDVIVAVPPTCGPALTSYCQDVATANWVASRARRPRWRFFTRN
jgi:hypothetical protein